MKAVRLNGLVFSCLLSFLLVDIAHGGIQQLDGGSFNQYLTDNELVLVLFSK